MRDKNYNHDLFVEQLSKIGSKKVQFQTLKKYMLNLPIDEFDTFLFGNIAKIQQGITELGESDELTKEDKFDLSKSFDGFIAMTKSLQKPTVTTS